MGQHHTPIRRYCCYQVRCRMLVYGTWLRSISHPVPGPRLQPSSKHKEQAAGLRALHLTDVLLCDHFENPLAKRAAVSWTGLRGSQQIAPDPRWAGR